MLHRKIVPATNKPAATGDEQGAKGMFKTFAVADGDGQLVAYSPTGSPVNATFAPHMSMKGRQRGNSVDSGDADLWVRVIDVTLALVGLLFFAPLMILIALLIGRAGAPVFYRHSRIGRGGVPFSCCKFRTMHVDGDEILARHLAENPNARIEWELTRKLRRDPRTGYVGAFMRKTSLDELPQLFNVLAGSMSIVGPRPIVAAEVERYGRYFDAYCKVRPGITGLWQISGRNGTTYRRRVACDVTYVRSRSAIRDMQIIMKTIPAVCFARGAY